ncbi:MAG TPA: hypothetical protein VFW89_04795 [Gemmatimonadaceae bacterium]|nr:hypothetical protein [Gemmatimonadaceae bacterium]
MTDQRVKSRPIAAARAIPWVPQNDGYYLLAAVMSSSRAAPLVVMQEALLEVEAHLRTVPGGNVCGLLYGSAYIDPRSAAKYLLVEEAVRAPRIDTAADPDAAALAMWSDMLGRSEQGGRLVLGWYRGGATIDSPIVLPAAGAMQVVFPERWQVGLLRQGVLGEHRGAFVRIEPTETRVYSIPFMELAPPEGFDGRTLLTSVTWTNYHTKLPVTPLGPASLSSGQKRRSKAAAPSASREHHGLGFLGAILKRPPATPVIPALRRSRPGSAPARRAAEPSTSQPPAPPIAHRPAEPALVAALPDTPPAIGLSAAMPISGESTNPAEQLSPLPQPDPVVSVTSHAVAGPVTDPVPPSAVVDSAAPPRAEFTPEESRTDELPATSETRIPLAPAESDPILADLRQRARLERLDRLPKPRSAVRRMARAGAYAGIVIAAGVVAAFYLVPRLRRASAPSTITQFGQLDSTQFALGSPERGADAAGVAHIPAGLLTTEQIGKARFALARVGTYGDDLATTLSALDSALASAQKPASRRHACQQADSLVRQTRLDLSMLDTARQQVTELIGTARLDWVDGLSTRARAAAPRFERTCR